jgi:two-component system, chemotaxis family, response regulator Rcp1
MTSPSGKRLDYKPVEILLVEDNPADVRLTREVLGLNRFWNNLGVAKDGVEAMAYLRQEGEFAGAPRPDLILLDLNLPRKDGRDVLAEIKASEDLKLIPVVVLTTSTLEDDIRGAYRLCANSFVTKPMDLPEFMKAVQSIEDYWFATARLPSRT